MIDGEVHRLEQSRDYANDNVFELLHSLVIEHFSVSVVVYPSKIEIFLCRREDREGIHTILIATSNLSHNRTPR